jgi:hypothetical protein
MIVPSLLHPVSYASSDIPSRLSDLVVSNSSKSDFQIFSPFSGIKALELLLHWNPIKNVAILEIDKIVDTSETPYDNLAEITQEYICFDTDNLLGLIEVTSESDEIYLRSKKEEKKKKRLKQLEEAQRDYVHNNKESAAISTAAISTASRHSRVTSAAVAPSNMFKNRSSLASYGDFHSQSS